MKKDLVVIINGGGTTGAELKSLYNYLAKNDNYFVYFPASLPGSFVGKYFPKATVKHFSKFIDETIEIMKEDIFDKVYLIGYSLGAATCAAIAAKCTKTKKVVLIAPIVKNPNYRKFFKGLTKSLSFSHSLTRIQRIFYKEFLIRFARIPKMHILHLQLYLIFARKYLSMITEPTLIIETLQDEMVKTKSIDKLEKMIKNKVDRYPVDSSHFLLFDKKVRNQVIEKVASYLEEELV